jgi:hypothetical protein
LREQPENQVSASVASTVRRVQDSSEIPVFIQPKPEIDQSHFRDEVERLCKRHDIRLRDFTNSGGNLWVLADASGDAFNKQLVAWGFQYKPGKGWWRKDG